MCFTGAAELALAQNADINGWLSLEDYETIKEPRLSGSNKNDTLNITVVPAESKWMNLDEFIKQGNLVDDAEPLIPSRAGRADIKSGFSSGVPNIGLRTILLTAGDWVDITFDKANNLSGEYLVSDIGSLKLPFVGNLIADGMTANELGSMLERLYGADILINPKITVKTRARMIGGITLSGLINVAGVYSVTSVIPLAEALSKGSGISGGQAGKDAIILRKTGGVIRARRVELDDITLRKNLMLRVFPGDIIEIIERETLPSINATQSKYPLLRNVLDGGSSVNF